MKTVELIVSFVLSFVALVNSQMMQGGGGDQYGGGMQGGGMQGGGMQGGGMQGGGMQGGGMQGGGMQGGGMQGGGMQGGGDQGIPRTAPCLTTPPPENQNSSGIFSGRWYVTKLYSDLMTGKPDVAPICIFLDIIQSQNNEEISFAVVHQGVFKNLTGTVNSKNYAEIAATYMLPGNTPLPLPLKTIIADSDNDNALFYSCGGVQGIYVHIGMVASRLKTSDPQFVSKCDQKLKSMEFKTEGMVLTNQNCPN